MKNIQSEHKLLLRIDHATMKMVMDIAKTEAEKEKKRTNISETIRRLIRKAVNFKEDSLIK